MSSESATYKFDPDEAIRRIVEHWRTFDANMRAVNPESSDHSGYEGFRYIIGISGGKDSLVAAALAKLAHGECKVVGVLMPNGKQHDIDDSIRICDDILHIERIEINIERAYQDLTFQFFQRKHLTSKAAEINLPPRLRMATLYMVAQSMRGIVVNTCNLSEDMVGYATLFGDNAGSYSPLKNLTVTEIKTIGHTLGLPADLVDKTPADGLQDASDEMRLGVTYDQIDRYIRFGKFATQDMDPEVVAKIDRMYEANKFKLDMVHIEGPEFDYPNYIVNKVS